MLGNFFCQLDTKPGREGTSIKELASSDLSLECIRDIFLIACWSRRAQPTVGVAFPRQVCLGVLKKSSRASQ